MSNTESGVTGPRAVPLDLPAIEARHAQYRAGNFGGEEAHAALVDVAALLDALRQTRAELQFALDATTVGPVKWLVPTKVGDDWMAWCVRAKQLLGGGGAVSGGPDL